MAERLNAEACNKLSTYFRAGTTKVDFLIVADCSGPIPNFIKVAIAKLIVEIALFHMKRSRPPNNQESDYSIIRNLIIQ